MTNNSGAVAAPPLIASSATFGSIGPTSINDLGTVAFGAALDGGRIFGIFTGDGSAATTVVTTGMSLFGLTGPRSP